MNPSPSRELIELPEVTDDGLGRYGGRCRCGGGLWTVREDDPGLVVCVESPEWKGVIVALSRSTRGIGGLARAGARAR